MKTNILDDNDTIVAIATPRGVGGVGVVRVSGKYESIIKIKKAVLGKVLTQRNAESLNFYDENKEKIDFGIAIFFKGPNSFTGEDVLELQGHGGIVVLNMLVDRIISLGARIAEPGEFSKRAFLNNKIDLAQSEGICDLIHASSTEAAKAAVKTLAGNFSKKIRNINSLITNIRVFIESEIDFSEEEIDFINSNKSLLLVEEVLKKIDEILLQIEQGTKLTDGIKAVIVGEPNVGKSTILNALSGEDRAIVTKIPGTTRDVLQNEINLDGVLLRISDTAGIRNAKDEIEKEGISRTFSEVKNADLIIIVFDFNCNCLSCECFGRKNFKNRLSRMQQQFVERIKSHSSKDAKFLFVFNKIDQFDMSPFVNVGFAGDVVYKEIYGDMVFGGESVLNDMLFCDDGLVLSEKLKGNSGLQRVVEEKEKIFIKAQKGGESFTEVFISAKHETGVDLLREQIKKQIKSLFSSNENVFSARRRHKKAVLAAKKHLLSAMQNIKNDFDLELIAEDLRLGHISLCEITGEFCSDKFLGEIFSTFCVGK